MKEKRRFCCGECEFIFDSGTESTWEKANPGEYWFTAQGYTGKCPRCAGYAHEYTGPIWAEKKEAPTMHVEYNGFTGELYKLERRSMFTEVAVYDLEIFDVEKKCNMQFFGVNLEDVKFLGGEVIFG